MPNVEDDRSLRARRYEDAPLRYFHDPAADRFEWVFNEVGFNCGTARSGADRTCQVPLTASATLTQRLPRARPVEQLDPRWLAEVQDCIPFWRRRHELGGRRAWPAIDGWVCAVHRIRRPAHRDATGRPGRDLLWFLRQSPGHGDPFSIYAKGHTHHADLLIVDRIEETGAPESRYEVGSDADAGPSGDGEVGPSADAGPE